MKSQFKYRYFTRQIRESLTTTNSTSHSLVCTTTSYSTTNKEKYSRKRGSRGSNRKRQYMRNP